MFDSARIAWHIAKLVHTGDPRALDRVIDLISRSGADPHTSLLSWAKEPQHRLLLGVAWRERAMDSADPTALEHAVEVLASVADGWPTAQAELALALSLGPATALPEVVELAHRAAAADPDDHRIAAILRGVTQEAARHQRHAALDLTATEPVFLDDLRAVIWSGTHDGTRKDIVVIGTEPSGPGAEDFMQVWSTTPWPDAVHLMVAQPDGTYRVLPYRRCAGLDLAEDALRCVTEPLRARGPYQIPGPAVRCYVIHGHFAGRARRVALLTPGALPDEPDPRQIFHTELTVGDPDEEFHWVADQDGAPVGDRRTANELMRRGPATLTSSEFGVAVLEFATQYEHAGLTFTWLAPPEHGFYSYGVRPHPDSAFSLRRSTGDWPPPDREIEDMAASWDLTEEAQARLYAEQTLEALALARSDPARLVDAFDRFSLHIRVTRPDASDDAEDTIALGSELAAALFYQQFPYAAEWVAEHTATFAIEHGHADRARGPLRHAAMSCESMGLFDTALRHYDQALDIPGRPEDARLERDLHLSFATTCVARFMAHDMQQDELTDSDTALLRRALDHLDTAAEMVAAEPAESTSWARMAIPAHRWRLRALLGEHEAAAAELGKLVDDEGMAAHTQLRKSTLLYWLLAMVRVATLAEFRDALARTWADPGDIGSDRAVVFYALVSDFHATLGEWTQAFLHAEIAHELQTLHAESIARLPLPGDVFAGHAAVDTLSRMCQAYSAIGRTEPGDEPRAAWLRALRGRVEASKSRWLHQDLINRPPLVSGVADDRLYAWTGRMRHDIRERVSVARESQAERLGGLSGNEKVLELLDTLPSGTALLSFYSDRESSYVWCTGPRDGIWMDPPLATHDVAKAVLWLQAGFSGTGRTARIDPDRPGDLPSRFLEPMRELGAWLSDLLPILGDSSMIMLSPHGPWHNVPLHMLLLPALWEAGANPALTYVPSLDIAVPLARRATRRPAPRSAALATYPLRQREEPLFRDAHDRLAAALPDADDVFGRDATPAEVMSMAGRTDLIHVLAHGVTRRADRDVVAESGLALSPGTGADGLLSAASLSTATLAGAHVTLQACSVGRLVAAATDELWGLSRSALLAGADSVLAPMWDVDLRSSTRLAELFYQSWLGEGKTKAQAFTEAQRALYFTDDDEAWRHPYHWAAYRLMGA